MKNSNLKKRLIVSIVSILAVISLCFMGVGCGEESPNAYVDDTRSVSVPGGGKLIVFAERQKYGSNSGIYKLVDYYVTGEYTGSQRVREITQTWTVNAQVYNQSEITLQLNGSSAPTYGIKVSSSTYEARKYWSNTNGSKTVYFSSNYELWPASGVSSHGISNSVKLIVSGHATPIIKTAGC